MQGCGRGVWGRDRAAEVLRATRRKPGYRCRPLVIGTATDPYQPVERERLITREILQVLAECRHPFSLITKSALVLRALDLIAPMAVEGMASVVVSVTTMDNRLKKQLEPRASGGRERLKTVRELARAGVTVTVLVAPLIPFINAQELADIVEQVAAPAVPAMWPCACPMKWGRCGRNGCSGIIRSGPNG